MLDIVCLIGFIIMSFKLIKALLNESEIHKEFNVPGGTVASVWLFSLGPVSVITLTYVLGWLPPLIIACICYIPALITSRKAIYILEKSGTSRTKNALNATNQVFGAAMLGLIYVALHLVLQVFSFGISGGITN